MGGVRISPQAAQDLDGIWQYIAKDSEQRADQVITQILKTADQLTAHPELGRRRDELIQGSRSISYRSYVILYEIVHERARLLRVVHGSTDLKQALGE
jgi:toxin ParE1/3/4